MVEPLREVLGPSVPVEALRPFDPTAGNYGRLYRRRDYYFRKVGRTSSRRAAVVRYRAIGAVSCIVSGWSAR